MSILRFHCDCFVISVRSFCDFCDFLVIFVIFCSLSDFLVISCDFSAICFDFAQGARKEISDLPLDSGNFILLTN